MKLSARNVLNGTVVDVVRGATMSHVKIDIGDDVMITASITNEGSTHRSSQRATPRPRS